MDTTGFAFPFSTDDLNDTTGGGDHAFDWFYWGPTSTGNQTQGRRTLISAYF